MREMSKEIVWGTFSLFFTKESRVINTSQKIYFLNVTHNKFSSFLSYIIMYNFYSLEKNPSPSTVGKPVASITAEIIQLQTSSFQKEKKHIGMKQR
jgi:hypothetical protein